MSKASPIKFKRYRVYAFAADGTIVDIREVRRDQRGAGYRYKLREVKRDMKASPRVAGIPEVARVHVEKVYDR